MKKQIMLIGLFVFSISGTINAQQEHSPNMKMNKHDHNKCKVKKYDVDSEFKAQLKTVVDSNQKIIEAFIKEEKGLIKKAVTEFSGYLVKADMSLLSGEAYDTWKEYLNEMKPEVKRLILANDIVFQRIHLAKLNKILYESLRSFGTGGGKVYYNYCSTANLVGASWLTTSNEIQNPYLDQKMLHCGSNKEILN